MPPAARSARAGCAPVTGCGVVSVLLLLVGAMLVAVLLVGAGDRLNLPWPVLMVVLGAGAAFVPGVDAPDIAPELILPLFLPPLLHATAQRASWAVFRRRWRTILLLAVGLVVLTVAAVAGTVVALLPGIAVSAALAVGAAVAPPDPVAVEAVAGPLRIPRRLVATLQSEGLFNDATSLVIFQVATAALLAGRSPGWLLGARFVYGVVAAVVVGLVAAWLVRLLMERLTGPVAPNALSLVLPFVVYLAADALAASGVVAVVVAALQVREHTDVDDSALRLTGGAFWDVVEMLVTGIAFALVGLELRAVVAAAGGELGRMVVDAVVVAAVVVAVRALWMTTAWWRLRDGADRSAAPRTGREVVVLTWSGMRGLATLALALALPVETPARSELVIIAGMVLVVTLVLPGCTLPLLLRVLGVRESEDAGERADRVIAGRARQAALAELSSLDREALGLDDDPVGEEVLGELRARFARIEPMLTGDDLPAPDADAGDGADWADRVALAHRRRETRVRVLSLTLAAARREVLAARSEPGVDPAAADRVLQRLDIRSMSLPPG